MKNQEVDWYFSRREEVVLHILAVQGVGSQLNTRFTSINSSLM